MNAYLIFITWFNILDYLLMFSKPIPEPIAAVFYFFTNFNFDHVLMWIITTALIKVWIFLMKIMQYLFELFEFEYLNHNVIDLSTHFVYQDVSEMIFSFPSFE